MGMVSLGVFVQPLELELQQCVGIHSADVPSPLKKTGRDPVLAEQLMSDRRRDALCCCAFGSKTLACGCFFFFLVLLFLTAPVKLNISVITSETK